MKFVLGDINVKDRCRLSEMRHLDDLLPQSESYGHGPSRVRDINNCISQEDESLAKDRVNIDI